MRKPHLAARIGDCDLPVVHVAREHEVEVIRFEPVERARKVIEQDAQVGVARQRVRIPTPKRALRIRARDPDRTTAQVEQFPLVEQQARRLEFAQLRRACHRIARDRIVVVAEHREHRLREALDELA